MTNVQVSQLLLPDPSKKWLTTEEVTLELLTNNGQSGCFCWASTSPRSEGRRDSTPIHDGSHNLLDYLPTYSGFSSSHPGLVLPSSRQPVFLFFFFTATFNVILTFRPPFGACGPSTHVLWPRTFLPTLIFHIFLLFPSRHCSAFGSCQSNCRPFSSQLGTYLLPMSLDSDPTHTSPREEKISEASA